MSKEARTVLQAIYDEQGIPKGPLANALHEMNLELGLSEPRTMLVKNYHKVPVDYIPPGEYGVVNQRTNHPKWLKPVVVAKKDKETKEGKE